jgi:hypothetical protein
MENKQREDGYYWVKWEGFWIVAEWHNELDLWFCPEIVKGTDDSFQAINETRLIPPNN